MIVLSTEIGPCCLVNSDGGAIEKVRQAIRFRVRARDAIGQSDVPFSSAPTRL